MQVRHLSFLKYGMKYSEMLLNLLFPPKCPFCKKVQDSVGICVACDRELPWIPEEHILPKESGGVRCAAPLWYEKQVRQALLELKFEGRAAVAAPLGAEAARCAAGQFGGEFDVVTWVPVGRKRLKKRGYDQAELLARNACRKWGIRPTELLKKTVDTPPQSGIEDAAARRANVLGVYEPVNAERIRNSRILLVDDIFTTGATMAECVRVLKEAGADSVVCVVAARTRRKQGEPARKADNRDAER